MNIETLFFDELDDSVETRQKRSALVESLFERMPVGMAIIDREYIMRRYNAAWLAFVDRYAPFLPVQIQPGVSLLQLFPGQEQGLLALLDRALAGETVRRDELELEWKGVVSYWDVVLSPMAHNDEVYGVLLVAADASDRVFAYRMLENANQQLEQRVETRTRELTTLLKASTNITSTQELEPLLNTILDEVRNVIEYSGAAIYILHDAESLDLLIYRGPIPQKALRSNLSLERDRAHAEVIKTAAPVIIPDVQANTPLAKAYRASAGDNVGYVTAWMGVPLIVRERVIGILAFDSSEPNPYAAHEATLATTFANQAAIAIENSRLRSSAEQAAVAAERSRIARELHDAVTQTLFAASLIAEVVPKLWERNPNEGRRRLAELRQLTRGALAEMRTLLLELRPSTLAEVELSDLVRQLGEALAGRARIPVDVTVSGQMTLPTDVKIALYRVAQETLNNIFKHAEASEVQMRLDYTDNRVCLSILDNGRGFDPLRVTPQSLGLKFMQERLAGIGGSLDIISQPGQGTRICAMWQQAEE